MSLGISLQAWRTVDDEQCNALPTKIVIFHTIMHHRTPPIFSTFSMPQYIHTQSAFLSHFIIEVVLKVHSHQFVTSIISIISDLFTTGSWRHHFHLLLPLTLHFVSSKTIQYWSHKNKIYTKGTILHKLSQELLYSVVPYWIGNIPRTVYSLRQLRLPPRCFQVSVQNFSKVRSIHKTMAFIRYRPRRLKHNSTSSTLRLVNYRCLIKFSTVSAYNSVFREVFKEAVKGIRVVSRSFEKFSSGIGFFFWNFLRLFSFLFLSLWYLSYFLDYLFSFPFQCFVVSYQQNF